MYDSFYGFQEPPFNITPDPRFLYFSDRHREAFNHILFGVRERKGFIQLTGEVGAGKTTVCRAILEQLGPRVRTALILNPCLTSTQLLRAILVEYGLRPSPRADRVTCLALLNQFLLDQAAAGNDVVLLIDEAQDLDSDLLEQVRLLSNLETDQRKLLQIVLIGQPELRDRLEERRLRQLRQRITVAIRAVHRYSGGVPRLINAVCDKALLCGYVAGIDQLEARHVRRAIRELEGKIVS